MAEKWRRCDKCRKVKPVEDFEEEHPRCQACEAPAPVRRTPRAGAPVTTTRMAPQPVSGEAATTRQVPVMRDLRGRGDVEVRARRARVRALDRLAEQFAEEFDDILAQERRAEGL